MSASINLEEYFSVESLIKAFEELEESKRDKFTGCVNIPMGADGITYQDFKKNLDRNVKEISRRVLSGKYQFYPLREVKVPKDVNNPSRGERPLKIVRIRDTLVQKQLYKALIKATERQFGKAQYDDVSVAYRKNKSAHTAIWGIWQYFKQDGFEWVLDADVKDFFEEINHKRMLDLIDDLVGKDSIMGKMLWRYTRTLYVPYEEYEHLSYREREEFFMKNKPPIPDSVRDAEKKGIPQGGVLSGMLANLYLHEFDKWVIDELKPVYDVRYFRYADDFVILAKSKDTVDKIAPMVKQKLCELHLEMHAVGGQKTKIVHIPTDSLEFLGVSINAEHIKVRQKNIDKFKGSFKRSLDRISRHDPDASEAELISEIVYYYANSKLLGPPDECEICGLPKRRYNWISFFAPVITDMKQLHDLDVWIRRYIHKQMYETFGISTHNRKQLIEEHGLQTLIGEYRRYKRGNFCKHVDEDSNENYDETDETTVRALNLQQAE